MIDEVHENNVKPNSGISKKIGYIFLLTLLLSFGLFLLPHQPSSNVLASSHTEQDNVEKAIALVKGPNPMEGIKILKKIVEKDPKNTEALYQLAFFSLQSGQHDKAIERFKQILEVDSTKTDVLYYLGNIYLNDQKWDEAEKNLSAFLSKNKDPKIQTEIEQNIYYIKLKKEEYAKR